ncbi:hypothetical protein TRVL_06278 [Trypanosoma vivax]|nr:hypothetical protein TRVL_06278 [Trypanosoma vivax]
MVFSHLRRHARCTKMPLQQVHMSRTLCFRLHSENSASKSPAHPAPNFFPYRLGMVTQKRASASSLHRSRSQVPSISCCSPARFFHVRPRAPSACPSSYASLLVSPSPRIRLPLRPSRTFSLRPFPPRRRSPSTAFLVAAHLAVAKRLSQDPPLFHASAACLPPCSFVLYKRVAPPTILVTFPAPFVRTRERPVKHWFAARLPRYPPIRAALLCAPALLVAALSSRTNLSPFPSSPSPLFRSGGCAMTVACSLYARGGLRHCPALSPFNHSSSAFPPVPRFWPIRMSLFLYAAVHILSSRVAVQPCLPRRAVPDALHRKRIQCYLPTAFLQSLYPLRPSPSCGCVSDLVVETERGLVVKRRARSASPLWRPVSRRCVQPFAAAKHISARSALRRGHAFHSPPTLPHLRPPGVPHVAPRDGAVHA